MRSGSHLLTYRFYDTSLSDRVEHGFQALALDEDRFPFSPTLWELAGGETDLRQVWVCSCNAQEPQYRRR